MTAKIGSLVADLQLETSAFTANLKKASAELNSNVAKMKRATNDLEKSFKSLNQSANLLQTGLKALIGSVVVGVAAKALQMADAYNVLQARLKQATKDTGDYIGVSKNLQAIASDTGTTLEDNVDVFQRLSIGAKDLGKSNQDVLKLLKIVDQLGAIGGSGPEAMKAGLLQFGQAMSAGIVRAEEFNSIVENLPLLANKIAKGLGVSTGQLRQMVINGKLLSSQVFDALLKQSDEINKDFQQMPSTMARGWNGFMETVNSSLGALDEGGGFTKSIADGFNNLTIMLKNNRSEIVGFGAAMGNTLKLLASGFVIVVDAFGATANKLADVAMRIIEATVNRALDQINESVEWTNKHLLTSLPTLKIDHSHDNTFGDEAKRYYDELQQEAGRFGKTWQKLMVGDPSSAAKGLNDQVSDKHGNPSPTIDKNAQAEAKKIAAFVDDLNQETSAIQRLLAAKKESDQAYEQTKLRIEAENEVLKKNLKLTDSQQKALIAQAYTNKINQKTIDFVGARRQVQQQIKDNMALAKARLQGHNALLAEQDKQAVDEFARTQGAGMRPDQVDALRIAKAQELATERAKAFTDAKAQQELELANAQKLFDAQKLGTAEYQKQQTILDAANQAKQVGVNLSDEQIKQLSDLNIKIAQTNKAQALLAEGQGLQQETKNMQRLTEARKAGVTAYQKMAMVISAENTVRQAGLSLLSEEGQALYNLSYNSELAQYQFQKLQSQMEAFAQVGQEVADSITGAFSQMILQGGKFSDVLKQLALNMAQVIFQQTVAAPAAKGLGSLFASIGSKLVTSFLTQGIGGNVGDFNAGSDIQFAATGADTAPGQPFIVGEKGPELFVPRSAGNIIPNGEFGAGGGQAIHITNIWQISTGVQQTVRAELTAMMPSIEKRTTNSVMTAINRGGSAAAAVGRKS